MEAPKQERAVLDAALSQETLIAIRVVLVQRDLASTAMIIMQGAAMSMSDVYSFSSL